MRCGVLLLLLLCVCSVLCLCEIVCIVECLCVCDRLSVYLCMVVARISASLPLSATEISPFQGPTVRGKVMFNLFDQQADLFVVEL